MMVIINEGGGFFSGYDEDSGFSNVFEPYFAKQFASQTVTPPAPVELEPVARPVIGQELQRITANDDPGTFAFFGPQPVTKIERLPTRVVAQDIQLFNPEIGGNYPVISSPTLRFDSNVPTIVISGVDEPHPMPATISGPGIFSDQIPAWLRQGREALPGASDPLSAADIQSRLTGTDSQTMLLIAVAAAIGLFLVLR